MSSVSFVEYERVAVTYEAGRGRIARPDHWHTLVARHLPRANRLRVLDLGAGTCIYARVWPAWGASSTVALDPSPAMLAQARHMGFPPGVHLVRGRGEAIPVRSGTVDLAWLSAVVHHLTDQAACGHELRRVLKPGGRVMIRGFFAGTSRVGWLEFFPGSERAIGRFPSMAQVEAAFGQAGFSVVAVEEAPEPDRPIPVVRSWCVQMRHADTLLSTFTEEEFTAGLAALEQAGQGALSSCLHLVVLE